MDDEILQDLKNQMSVILNSTHEGVMAVDSQGRITVFNRAAEELTGVKAKDAIGRLVTEVIPNTRLHLLLRTGATELNQRQQLGHITIVTNRVPIKDVSGKIIGAVAVFRDITDVINLAEEVTSLKETQMMLQAIINSTQDAISVVDENGMGLLINPAYTRLTGFTEKDVINQPATVDIAEGESMHLQVLRTGQPVKGVPMKVGPARKAVLVDAAPIVVRNVLKGSVAVIHDVSEIFRLSEELDSAHRLIRRLEAKYSFDDIVGVSEEITYAIAQAKKAAEIPATVLLRGESGTGKELFAHAIHNTSLRRRGQFVRVSCAAIPESLLESELFGYVEGAFTGAKVSGRRGYFEEADKGTLFLDEVGEINLTVQAKLLRVLQEREIVRVGDNKPVSINVRIIAATNANLEERVKKGQFREDLYYRLNVVPVYIPPLRQRKADIPHLASYLIRKFNQEYGRNVTGISPGALNRLMDYFWPGNVRELENILGRAIINLGYGQTTIEAEHLPPLVSSLETQISGSCGMRTDRVHWTGGALEEMRNKWEKEVVAEALAQVGGNRAKAAELLDISIRSLYQKLRKFGIS
ncbi:MAG: sigma-54-dependent transcriptional regulator [Syntrophomonadaceae bacterium]|nr:sigma-54-dependent transcriptional regulator [Syntrophomonadaceae bacterium]